MGIAFDCPFPVILVYLSYAQIDPIPGAQPPAAFALYRDWQESCLSRPAAVKYIIIIIIITNYDQYSG